MHELLKRGAIDIDYHACMPGADRDKAQRLRTDMPGLAPMALLCDGRHAHKPWGAKFAGKRFAGFSSADEAENLNYSAAAWPKSCRRRHDLGHHRRQGHHP
eukprot:15873053-Heterocapsa_arctica.AAC.1